MDSEDDRSYTTLLTEDDPELYSNQTLPSPNPSISTVKLVGKSKRSTNFTKDEELILVSGWLNVSKDGAVGNEQGSRTFWERIVLYIQENGGGTRTIPSLKTKWGDINKACGKFVGWHAQVENRPQSGTTIQSRLEETRNTYKRMCNNKVFKFEHCWEVLRDEPKWTSQLTAKRSKNHPDASPGFSPTTESINSDDNVGSSLNHSRPLGKKQQLKNKGKEVVQDKGSAVVLGEYLERKIELQTRTLAQHQEAIKIEAEKSASKVKELELEQRKADNEIMLMDLTQMDNMTAQYFYNMKMDIIAKRRG